MYQSARILLVGGDLPVRQATRRFLRKAGYEVAETGTGEECLRLAQAQRPDLILLDTVLPDMDGVEVCRRIKAEPALVGCLILLAGTINTSSDNRARGLEAGAEGWIIRPISNRELLLQVGVMLRFKQAEERLVHLNAILRAVRSVNQLIVRGKDRAWLLREACRSLIQAGSYSGAWIALWDESGALVTAEEAGLAEYSSALVERLERGEARLYCAQVALQQADVLCIEQALSNCGDCPLISVCQSSKAMAPFVWSMGGKSTDSSSSPPRMGEAGARRSGTCSGRLPETSPLPFAVSNWRRNADRRSGSSRKRGSTPKTSSPLYVSRWWYWTPTYGWSQPAGLFTRPSW